MKQEGKCIIGNQVCIDNYTAGWPSIKIHPSSFYRKYSDINYKLKSIKGLYTYLDFGQYVVVRFSNEDDMHFFNKK
jgi:hypothetical protein